MIRRLIRGPDFSFVSSVQARTRIFKEPSLLEQKAYRDTWGVSAVDRERGERVTLTGTRRGFTTGCRLRRDLLTEQGTIYGAYRPSRGALCEDGAGLVFGADAFINEIVWQRSDAHSDIGQGAKHLGRICDNILLLQQGAAGPDMEHAYTPVCPDNDGTSWYRHVGGRYRSSLQQSGHPAQAARSRGTPLRNSSTRRSAARFRTSSGTTADHHRTRAPNVRSITSGGFAASSQRTCRSG